MNRTLRRPESLKGQVSSEALAAEVERTQNRIDQTITQLASKMNTKSIGSEIGAYLVDSLEHFELGDIRRIASHTADRTGQVIKEHPVPVLLGCLAIASFFLPREWRSLRREEEEAHGRIRSAAEAAAASASAAAERLTSAAAREAEAFSETARSTGHAVSEYASQGAEALSKTARATGQAVSEYASQGAEALSKTARSTGHAVSEYASQGVDKLDEFAHLASEKISDAAHLTADVAREQSARLRSAATDTAENHPLGMALGALAVGFLTALVIPRTKKEQGLMGNTAGNVREYVKGVGSALAHDAKEILHENDLDPEGLQKRAVRAIDRATSKTRRGIEDHLDR